MKKTALVLSLLALSASAHATVPVEGDAAAGIALSLVNAKAIWRAYEGTEDFEISDLDCEMGHRSAPGGGQIKKCSFKQVFGVRCLPGRACSPFPTSKDLEAHGYKVPAIIKSFEEAGFKPEQGREGVHLSIHGVKCTRGATPKQTQCSVTLSDGPEIAGGGGGTVPYPGVPRVEPQPVTKIEDQGLAQALGANAADFADFMKNGNEITESTIQHWSREVTNYTVTVKNCTHGGFVGHLCRGGAVLTITERHGRSGSMETVKYEVETKQIKE